jgi:hypothetical protein
MAKRMKVEVKLEQTLEARIAVHRIPDGDFDPNDSEPEFDDTRDDTFAPGCDSTSASMVPNESTATYAQATTIETTKRTLRRYNMCWNGCGKRGSFRSPDGKLYCVSCKPDGSVCTRLCVDGCGKGGCFRSPNGKLYCASCKPDGSVRTSGSCIGGCGTLGCFRSPDGKRYCASCKPEGSVRAKGLCAGGCGKIGIFRSSNGKLYCMSCKPTDAVSVHQLRKRKATSAK